MSELSGKRMDPAAVQAMLEVINGCMEPGRLSMEDKERWGITLPRIGNPKIGRIMVFGTGDDSGFKELWMESDKTNNK